MIEQCNKRGRMFSAQKLLENVYFPSCAFFAEQNYYRYTRWSFKSKVNENERRILFQLEIVQYVWRMLANSARPPPVVMIGLESAI